MKGVQCYELFGGIALKNHTFSFSFGTHVRPTEQVQNIGMHQYENIHIIIVVTNKLK